MGVEISSYIINRGINKSCLTKTKNWSGRNEVTETSGRLHPLWPQNKWLHTPRTTDYRHTRQNRWIQAELDFTLAKNATKPNPFEIIPLQTKRKENNWKTEEELARTAVTLEKERMKGTSPLYLWWWWWFILMRTSSCKCIDIHLMILSCDWINMLRNHINREHVRILTP